ncbi:MAG TPA: ATP-binding domain-containing protein, partial [Vulgatibacter sp.]
QIGYRCPPPIADFAHAIQTGAGTASDAVRIVGHAHESHLVSWLVDELRALRLQDPAATIGVVARNAEKFSRLLSRAITVVDAEELRPGNVHVVSVLAAKGLEFDTVIVADADDRSYPDSPESRRALYVAVTRATHQLVLTWSGKPSPLIRP